MGPRPRNRPSIALASNLYPCKSGIPVGAGGKRGPSTGVRVSAKRQKSPLVLSAEQVKLGLAQLEFRDQLLVFLDSALGIRQGGTWGTALAGLRVRKHEFQCAAFLLLASGWAPEVHKTKTEASAKLLPMHPSLKQALLEWRSQSLYNRPGDFVFASERLKGSKPLNLASVLKKKIQPAFRRIGITGVGWQHISPHGGNHAGRDGRTSTSDPGLLAPRDFARNQQVFSGNDNEQAFGTRKAGGRHSARRRDIGKQINSGPLGFPTRKPYWTQIVFGGSA